MNDTNSETSPSRLKEIALAFLKLGATAFGGPAIIGVMQAELQERRQWVSKERFVEGVSLASMLPGATATQIGIFLGYARGGWWGGLLAGLCFVLQAFAIMLALAMGVAAFGATPLVQGALYGLGPVVLAIFLVAVMRLGKTMLATTPQRCIGACAVLLAAFSPLGIVQVLALAGGVGVWMFHSRKAGLAALGAIACLTSAFYIAQWLSGGAGASAGGTDVPSQTPGLIAIGAFFLKVGAFSFGGGLTLIAFIQEQVVQQHHWLTQQEFIAGLALGQFTPGPILMVAAYVGYKLAGIAGATVAAAAIFLPAFVLMLSMLAVFERVRRLVWTRAAMKGIGPAVIGVLAVSLLQMAPHALADPLAGGIFVLAMLALLVTRMGPFKAMALGALVGALRDRVVAFARLQIG